eukprot:2563560-Prymnesium_polylepis.1
MPCRVSTAAGLDAAPRLASSLLSHTASPSARIPSPPFCSCAPSPSSLSPSHPLACPRARAAVVRLYPLDPRALCAGGQLAGRAAALRPGAARDGPRCARPPLLQYRPRR